MAQFARWWAGEWLAFSALVARDCIVRTHTALSLFCILCSDKPNEYLESCFGQLYFAENDEWRQVVEFWFELVASGKFIELFPWRWLA
jgi:hypothetical protein